MDPALLTPLGLEMLGDLPPFWREDPDLMAVIHCQAREHERKQATLDALAANVFPQSADELLLGAWEWLVGAQVNPVGLTVTQRRDTLMAYLATLRAAGTGLWWEQTVSKILGPDWSYKEYIPPDMRMINLVPNPSFAVDAVTWGTTRTAGIVDIDSARTALPPAAGVAGFAWREHVTDPDTTIARTSGIVSLTAALPNALDVVPGGKYTLIGEVYSAQLLPGEQFRMDTIEYDNAGIQQGSTSGDLVNLALGWQRYAEVRTMLPTTELLRINPEVRLAAGAGGGVGDTDTYFTKFMVVEGDHLASLPNYFDGDLDGDWLGTAHASASREHSPPEGTIEIQLPFAPSSTLFAQTEALLRRITDSHIDLILTSAGGFVLDQSQLDQEEFR